MAQSEPGGEMKTETILEAIQVLNEAREALRAGNLSIAGQMALGARCSNVSFSLRHELTVALPRVDVRAAEPAKENSMAWAG